MAAGLRSFWRCTSGAMAVEVALLAPLLILFSVGAFEASSIVARQSELQGAASDVGSITLSSNGVSNVSPTTVRDILMVSTGLDEDNVEVVRRYRCGVEPELIETQGPCEDENAVISNYFQITLHDRYRPLWTEFGIGKPIDFEVERTVQIS